MVTAPQKLAREESESGAPTRRASEIEFYSPIGIQAVAAAAAQMRRSQLDEALRAVDFRRDEPAILRERDAAA